LPLAIPPFANTSSKYVSGLFHITPIYTTFETLWQEIVESTCQSDDPREAFYDNYLQSGDLVPITENGASQVETINPRTHSLLSFLLLPSLLRSNVLRHDIQALTGTSEDEIEEQLEKVSKHGNLAEFIEHMENSIGRKPHVILAYAWVLYMALFSGGRILRGVLQAASGIGRLFWERELSPIRPLNSFDGPRHQLRSDASSLAEKNRMGRSRSRSLLEEAGDGLGFFSFPGTEDGEDIKTEFKKRYAEIEVRLTEEEKADTVEEALHIFKFMLGIIDDLDNIVGTSEQDMEAAKSYHKASKLGAVRNSVDQETKEGKSHGKMDVLLRLLHIKEALPSLGLANGAPLTPVLPSGTPLVATEQDPLHLETANIFWMKGAAMAVPTLGCLVLVLAWQMSS
jgi:heme oxygenase